MANLIGTAVGRYQLEALLGVGGMAEVYRAVDRELGRTVAVKVVLPHIAGQTEFRERFQREARLVAALEHPNIVPVYDVGEHQGLPYLVMPFYEGGSLASRLDGRPLPTAQSTRWLADLARALDAAHASGVLHRDVKPSNALIDHHGRALLADFGVALAVNAMTRLTTTGAVVGTPGYLAPEIAMGEPATPASDRYSLAVLAYELVTGRVPFFGESAIAVLHQHATRPVPPLSERLPGAPEELDRVLRQALAKRPEERTETAIAFTTELTEVLTQLAPSLGENASAPTRLQTTSPAGPTWPARPAHKARLGLLGWLSMVALVVAGTLGGLALWRALEPAPPIETGEWVANEPAPAPAADEKQATPNELQASESEPLSAELQRTETPTRPAVPKPTPVPARQEPEPERRAANPAAPSRSEVPEPVLAAPPAEVPALEPENSRLPAQFPAPLANRGLNTRRPRELPQRSQAMSASAFAELADRAKALSRRPRDAARATALAAFARGGSAYVEGRLDEAAATLLQLATMPGMALVAGGTGPLALMVLREHAPGTPVESWELAVGYGDARGEGLAAVNAALEANPGNPRLLLGRAQLHRLAGNHEAALADAEACYRDHTSRRAGLVAMFIAEIHAALGSYPEAINWYRQAITEGGRLGGAAALEAARLAEERLRDRKLVLELLSQACQLGQTQACHRAERLKAAN